jgi:ubiquinone/menaquinone biosynthesis C-methylase UbiE
VKRIELANQRPALSLVIATLVFMIGGRPAAQLASRPVDEWAKVLDTPERLASLKVNEVVRHLKLKPGDVVADLGAGTGAFVVSFAKAVPAGRVYAVEIDGGFRPYIQRKAEAAAVTNVRFVLGEFTDPKLPAADVDCAFLHDVLHHIQDRAVYLKRLSSYLKPTARIVVIDYDPSKSPHRDQPAMLVSKEQAEQLLAQVGFKPAEAVPLFADKWFVVFTR